MIDWERGLYFEVADKPWGSGFLLVASRQEETYCLRQYNRRDGENALYKSITLPNEDYLLLAMCGYANILRWKRMDDAHTELIDAANAKVAKPDNSA